MHNNIIELQTSGLIVTAVILLLALVLLNRAASELHRSRSQRVKSEQTFERIESLLSARVDSSFEGIRGGRVTMSGPVVRSSRPMNAKAELKPAPRTEPKVTTLSARLASRGRSLN